MKDLVHVLRGGEVLCNAVYGPPARWPTGHRWLSEEQFRKEFVLEDLEHHKACNLCRIALDDEDRRAREMGNPTRGILQVRHTFDLEGWKPVDQVEDVLVLEPEAVAILQGDTEPFREKQLAEAAAREGKTVRDHPNYQRPAFTLEEAEKHALVHQTVGAFRMLKALHEALELMTVAEMVALEEHEQLGKACLKVVQLQKKLDDIGSNE